MASHFWNQKSQSKLHYDRQSVGHSILVSGTHLGPATNFSHSLFDYILDSFGFVDVGHPLWGEVKSVVFSLRRASPAQPFSDLSPMRGRFCSLLLLLVFTSAVPIGSESRGTQNHILLLQFLRLPQPGGQVPVFILPTNRVAQLYTRALGSWRQSSPQS
jgi:hypothetical protein